LTTLVRIAAEPAVDVVLAVSAGREIPDDFERLLVGADPGEHRRVNEFEPDLLRRLLFVPDTDGLERKHGRVLQRHDAGKAFALQLLEPFALRVRAEDELRAVGGDAVVVVDRGRPEQVRGIEPAPHADGRGHRERRRNGDSHARAAARRAADEPSRRQRRGRDVEDDDADNRDVFGGLRVAAGSEDVSKPPDRPQEYQGAGQESEHQPHVAERGRALDGWSGELHHSFRTSTQTLRSVGASEKTMSPAI
jgi:hypothetical protein